ncbi:eukaryotic translation initiation factor 4E transporter isoform X2 [Triplophysa rosa]|uniref:eukaryotic translation initiation factor 4E transporter isoform X2 n=1 Tax=Triplophysa rosa TaxID=992332 RepID=UPI00254633FE|nr:eukaryotic translation initiation factor 4E transporter isoform X2 [Triplophysa rosa]
MEKDENGETMVETIKDSVVTSAYRYTKEELLEIKELPVSNERPECLSEKYDSDGVWDPEKWHASLYPSSENNCPAEGYKKDFTEDRVPLKRRIGDPRERVKDDDLEVVLSPQRRSFGGGCQVAPTAIPRRPISPLENKENESLRLGGTRRIGSGRIMASRVFEREVRVEKERERDRDREFKDKRFRRDFGDKRVFSERRRNDSYAEEEPEWFSGGPTSQSETIELIGFDDKILEDDKRRTKRSRKKPESVREVDCNGGLDPGVVQESGADQEVPHAEVLPEQPPGEFDFNEFFNLEKTMPGLASMIEDVLGEGPVSASRFSRWFSNNPMKSPAGSRSSSLRSTPHEELERLAGALNPGLSQFFTPIPSAEHKEKVDILELLHKANIDLKPLLSSLNINKARLKESTNSGVVLSLEEVEVGLKGLKVQPEPAQPLPQRQLSGGGGTPFMAEHLEEALTGGAGGVTKSRDPDMSAFNKFVSSMKASGTLPTHPKAGGSNLQQQSVDPALVPLPEAQVPASQQKNIFQELFVPSHGPVPASMPGLMHHRASPPLFPQRSPIQDFYQGMPPVTGFPAGPQTVLDQIPDFHRARTTPQMRALQMGVDQASLEALFQQDLAVHNRPQYSYNKHAPDKLYRNRQPRMTCSPVPHMPGRTSPTVTSVLSASFTPTSVIKKMYESKEKSRDDPGSRPGSKEETVNSHSSQDDGPASPITFLEDVDTSGPQTGGVKACSTPVPSQNRHSKDPDRPRPPSTTGHHTPTMLSPGPSSPFPRHQMYPVPLLPHVPLVRPPPQLHPSVMQRMLVQGIQPQLGPPLLQTGIFPQTVDLSQLQGLPPALLGQPLYPIGPAGHPLMAPRAAGPNIQLAVMQQQLQQQRPNLHVGPSGQSQSHGPHRTHHSQRRGGSPTLGLAKWFGSDMLQQPLPSMPSAKVISVDELEFRQ